uniref:Putative secreted protein n=1 Tax=Ixodes scapularis TaxID=6945 RepID=A0A4D5RW97_IXOSC
MFFCFFFLPRVVCFYKWGRGKEILHLLERENATFDHSSRWRSASPYGILNFAAMVQYCFACEFLRYFFRDLSPVDLNVTLLRA